MNDLPEEYRTAEQFDDICEDMYNGNWTNAAQNCAKFGFYANDLREHQADAENDGRAVITDIWDFVELIEIATKYR